MTFPGLLRLFRILRGQSWTPGILHHSQLYFAAASGQSASLPPRGKAPPRISFSHQILGVLPELLWTFCDLARWLAETLRTIRSLGQTNLLTNDLGSQSRGKLVDSVRDQNYRQVFCEDSTASLWSRRSMKGWKFSEVRHAYKVYTSS